jgi:hypothetical protein
MDGQGDDAAGRAEGFDAAGGIVSVQDGHFHIKEDDVGLQGLRLPDRFEAIAGFTYDFDAACKHEQGAQVVAHLRGVIHEQHPGAGPI